MLMYAQSSPVNEAFVGKCDLFWVFFMQKAAVIGLHMLLGGLCALTLVISLRFVSIE
jgi:hypothetical protein